MSAPALVRPAVASASASAPVTYPAPAAQATRALRAVPGLPYGRPRVALGDPAPLACTVAKTAVEVVIGLAGIHKLNRWVSGEIRLQLARQNSLARRAHYQPLGSVSILRVRVYRVSATAAEVSVVAREGDRLRAVAMRMQDVAGKWQASALEIG